jgi:DNA-binding FadR family transcriptional regulator
MIRSARSERKTLSEVAGHKLRQAITGGIYRPGSQLPTEGELCEMPGISRTVTREALRILEDDGLVTRRRGPTRLRVASIEGAQ